MRPTSTRESTTGVTRKEPGSPFGVYFRRQQINDNLLLTHQLISDWELLDNLELKAGISYNHIKGLEPDRRENYLYLTPERSYALMGSNRQKRFFSELIESDINVKASLTYRLRGRFGSDASAITFGYDGRLVDDAFESIEYNYDPYNPVPFQLNEVRLDEVYNPDLCRWAFPDDAGRAVTYRVSKYIHWGAKYLSTGT